MGGKFGGLLQVLQTFGVSHAGGGQGWGLDVYADGA